MLTQHDRSQLGSRRLAERVILRYCEQRRNLGLGHIDLHAASIGGVFSRLAPSGAGLMMNA